MLALSLGGFAVTLPACDRAVGATDRGGPLERLARTQTPRVFAPRLSVVGEYRPCSLHAPPEGTILRADCGPRPLPSPEILDLMGEPGDGPIEDLARVELLLDLIWSDSLGNFLQPSISSLRMMSGMAMRRAPFFVDLAAAYLVRAEWMQTPRDLLEAIEAAAQAVELDPQNAAGWFNLALALDRLGLDGQAAQAWRHFLMVESTSGWAGEARRRLDSLVATVPPAPPGSGASTAAVGAYVARQPQEARLRGWEQVLGEWGAAVLNGDSVRAEDRLRLAGSLGLALEARRGDATLADAVRAIHARSGDRVALRTLAQAHHAYAEGRVLFLSGDMEGAGARFAEVLAARPPSAPLQAWARMYHTATLTFGRKYARAERAFRRLMTQTDTVRHLALAGSVRWGLATTLLRTGRFKASLDASHDAVRFFERSGERENVGGIQYVAADAEFSMRASLQGYASMHRALLTLRPYRGSVWLHNLLSVSAEAAALDGLPRAAARIQEEAVLVAERSGRAAQMAEARLWRARLLAEDGDPDHAEAIFREAEALIGRLKAGDTRSFLETDLRIGRAGVFLRTDPARSAAVLDTVLEGGKGPAMALHRLQALVGRASARLALGNTGGATLDLDSATALLHVQHEALARTALRASLVDAARGVFDRLVMLKLAAGDTVGALAYLERGRSSFATVGPREAGTVKTRWSVPRGTVAVEYAHIGDTLLIWAVADTSVHMVRRTLRQEPLARAVERVRDSLEHRAGEPSLRRDLAPLYDWLVRPVEGRLGRAGTPLAVIADGEIAKVPFAALFDADRGRYLAQDHALRFLSSLRDVGGGRKQSGGRLESALFIADPALAPRVHAGLGRLPGAAAEIEAVAAGYPRRTVLRGEAADRAALQAVLPEASIVHFAGHAVFDDERPDRSYLVLAPRPGVSDRLTAGEIADMDLRHVRLVVLAACQTLPSRGGRSGGFAGFTDALLAAGADGVVGSQWRVSDELTRTLMVEFHSAYRHFGDGPAALHTAQLRLLRHPEAAYRSPAAWAGFRYAGN